MTKLNKEVKRTVEGLLRGKNLVVTLYPHAVLGLRQAKTRREYTIPLMTCYRLAIQAHLASVKAEKKARRKHGSKN